MKWKRFKPGLLAGLILCTMQNADARRYNHPSGLGFDYPDDWVLSEQEEVLLLTPSAPLGDERVIIGAESMQGVASLTDAAVLQWFDQQMTALTGTGERKGEPEVSAWGVTLNYRDHQGRTHRVRYKSLQGLGAFVIQFAVNPKHDTAVARLFTSLGGQLAFDPALVGHWVYSSGSNTGTGYSAQGDASYAMSSREVHYRFDNRQQVDFSSSSTSYAQGSAGAVTSSVSSAPQQSERHGRYAANGRRISIIWDNGDSAEWDYRLDPPQGRGALILTSPDSGKEWLYSWEN